MKRSLATLMAVALVGAAFIAPAEAAKKKKKKVCKPYVAGEAYSEFETLKVTDAATEEAPLEYDITLAESLGDADLTGDLGAEVGAPFTPSQQFVNVQVDPKAKETGLYVLFEFDEHNDYDLFVRHADGSEAGSSHAFQPMLPTADAPNEDLDFSNQTGNGGESTSSSEKVVGLRTADCGGYTIEAANWLGFGGDFTLKIWLGEAVNDPLPPAGAEEA